MENFQVNQQMVLNLALRAGLTFVAVKYMRLGPAGAVMAWVGSGFVLHAVMPRAAANVAAQTLTGAPAPTAATTTSP